MVRAFVVDDECRQMGAVLVNDVVACTPGEPGACLDGLALSSRVKTLRFYK
jgi:molybdopterin biosynthesis enzyme MoaB